MEEKVDLARAIVDRLAAAQGPTQYFLPTHGIQEWDRPGEPVHDPDGLSAFVAATKEAAADRIDMTTLDCHINDAVFCEAVLQQQDAWINAGIVPKGKTA